jgi:hypothetical protein
MFLKVLLNEDYLKDIIIGTVTYSYIGHLMPLAFDLRDFNRLGIVRY